MMVHVYNTNYKGSWTSSALGKSVTFCLKKIKAKMAEVVAQVSECLPTKCKALV
jgi:hypothetical protein